MGLAFSVPAGVPVPPSLKVSRPLAGESSRKAVTKL